jgi:hypothetical protein
MIDSKWKATTWSQFGAAIDTLKRAIEMCPDDLWYDATRHHQFWYMAHHAIFWLDFYLTGSDEDFRPPEPFGLEELDPAGVIPDPPYTKAELMTYLQYARGKCRETIESMTEEKASGQFQMGRVKLSVAELLLYNLRHVQHHAAQMVLILRQKIDDAPGWVFKVEE